MGLRLAVNLYGKKAKAKRKEAILVGYDVFKFGALYWNDDVQPIPQNPSYTGDIPQYDNIKAISIKEAEQKITWIKPYGLNLLVADRVLMANASWEDLQRSGLDKGIPILVGGQRFLCRMPQVGLLGDENEWDQILDITGEDDSLWHWYKMYFWGRDNASGKIHQARGFVAARKWANGEGTIRYFSYGFRPVLEPMGSNMATNKYKLDGVDFRLSSIPGGDGYCPVLQPVNRNALACIPNGHRLKMYTLMEDGRPVHFGATIKDVSKLTLTDRYYGDEYLVPWTISNGIAVASQSMKQQI